MPLQKRETHAGGCPYYGSRRAVAEAKRMGFCWKLLQFNPLISWRSCTNDKESQTVGLVNLLLFWWNHVFIYVSQRHLRVLTCWLSHLLWEDDFRSYYRWYLYIYIYISHMYSFVRLKYCAFKEVEQNVIQLTYGRLFFRKIGEFFGSGSMLVEEHVKLGPIELDLNTKRHV